MNWSWSEKALDHPLKGGVALFLVLVQVSFLAWSSPLSNPQAWHDIFPQTAPSRIHRALYRAHSIVWWHQSSLLTSLALWASMEKHFALNHSWVAARILGSKAIQSIPSCAQWYQRKPFFLIALWPKPRSRDHSHAERILWLLAVHIPQDRLLAGCNRDQQLKKASLCWQCPSWSLHPSQSPRPTNFQRPLSYAGSSLDLFERVRSRISCAPLDHAAS